MARNESLSKAKKAKNDEFYTQLSDIENELKHYGKHFENKTILCNCDDPYESNFFKYFALQFNHLKLKKLIAISYCGSPVQGVELSLFEENKTDVGRQAIIKKPYKVEITEVKDETGDGRVGLPDVEYLIKNDRNVSSELTGNGDFRSPECIELLKEADVVATNPPFSLFREYVAQLIEYDKKFVIIGNINAITYKEIFPLIKNNKIWLGYGFKGAAYFYAKSIHNNVTNLVKFGNCIWFTNLDFAKRHEPLDLVEKYTPEKYPKYDNYDAINVDRTLDIPADYDGVMGVPISFIDKYCPEQFEIVGHTHSGDSSAEVEMLRTDQKHIYDRILIKRKACF